MTSDRLQQLLDAWHQGIASRDEIAELMHLLHDPSQQEALHSLFPKSLSGINDIDAPETLDYLYEELKEKISSSENSSIPWYRKSWLRYAAAMILISATVALLFNNKEKRESASQIIVQPSIKPSDISPGGDKAVLTLGNGQTIILDSAQNGVIASYQGATVKKHANGEVSYQSSEQNSAAITFNTMTTPRGGHYQLRLPDKSVVWLNAASSITFPTAFSSNERMVEMTGEVYFEVSHDKSKPFRVKMKDGTVIQVTGTSFNVNDYGDEQLSKTTLLTGSVNVISASTRTALKPGQQAQITRGDAKAKIINDVDVGQVMAWQKGMFEFNNTDLKEIMRQVSRWYDVDVEYANTPSEKKYGGGISRKLPLSNVLKLLEANGVKFTLEGRKLRVNQ